MKIKTLILSAVAPLLIAMGAQQVYSHCQIPCGIYDDEGVFDEMLLDVQTIKKSMTEISSLSAAGDKNFNQVVRWVENKDHHADKIINTAANYFLAQRLAVAEPRNAAAFKKYQEELGVIHRIIVHAMKAKQTTDSNHPVQLESLIEILKTYHQK